MPPDSSQSVIPVEASAAAILSMGLSACGGGGSSAPSPGSPPATPPSPSSLSQAEASRFLAQASPGFSSAELASVVSGGFEGWIAQQMTMPRTQSHWDWLLEKGYGSATNINNFAGLDNTLWRKLMGSPDSLRQRITLALSEIFVVSAEGMTGPWRQFAIAHYVDILERHAFGNLRDLLEDISLSPAMGNYLTFRGNAKANPARGSVPDENFAREVMQLFTIGLVELNADGTPRLRNGVPLETYTNEDVSGLARVFTGYDYDTSGLGSPPPPELVRRPMVQVASRHETGEKRFLGVTIPANTAAAESRRVALDTLFNHPNTAPFLARQLIQRLVTSNPSPAYVGRVAAAFQNNGQGVRGDLSAVIRAVLLDLEARSSSLAAQADYGKIREPIVRLIHWARAVRATSVSGIYSLGSLSDPATQLGQSPLRSPSVFNFFRPGYGPTSLAARGLVAPELQITTETSTAGYINFMQRVVAGSTLRDLQPDWTEFLTLAGQPAALVDRLALLFTADRLSTATRGLIAGALQSMPSTTEAQQLRRLQAAQLLVLVSPEFIVQR